MARKLTEEQEKEILRLYGEGLSTRTIADRFPVSHETIRRTLDKRGKKRRTAAEALRILTKEQEEEIVTLYDEGLSQVAIEDRYPVNRTTIWQTLKRKGATFRDPIEAIRKATTHHTHDAAFFDVIDTEEKAYWVGFIMADGCVHKFGKDGYLLSVGLKKSDKGHLVKLKHSLHASHQIVESKISYSLKINSPRLCKALIKHGVVPRKSGKQLVPPHMQSELLRHFWRGYFDGDGSLCEVKQRRKKDDSVGKRWDACLAGSHTLLQSFADWLQAQSLLAKPLHIERIKRTSKVLVARLWRKSDVYNAMEVLYEDAKIYLDRKMERYERCKKDGKAPKPTRKMESTEEQQREIVKLYDEGLSSPAIARMFGVCQFTVRKVLERQGRKRRTAAEARHMYLAGQTP